MLEQSLAPSTINLRLSPLRKLAREMADNDLLESSLAGGIIRTKGVKQQGVRVGNWLLRDQARDLLNAPSAKTLIGIRDRAILAVLLGCGLRRVELLRLQLEDLQQRDGRWVIPDLVGKGNRIRTIPVPAWVKARIDAWLKAAELTSGTLFRVVRRGGHIGEPLADEKTIWRIVLEHAEKASLGPLSPHDLRRTCAKLCRKAGGELEQIQFLLGHSSIQTTERYLGSDQNISTAVNDSLGLDV